ncbi:MAG: hypothetical protein QOH68_3472 [Nocardioidaceae bacterium]|nr:hypothetical protein [Nocardioidaceae bacterium]
MVPNARYRSVAGRLSTVALVVLVAAAASFASASPAAADTPSDEARLYQLTNQSRADNGLAALAYDPLASNVARRWSEHMAASNDLQHNPNLVAEVDAQVTNQWSRLGENVGYTGTVDGAEVAYMNSAPHRHNILGDFNRVGVGIARAGDGRVWSTVVFLLAPPIPASSPASYAPVSYAPFASASALVDQQYRDLLGRAADAGAVSGWGMSLQTGQTTQATLVTALVESPELSALVKPVTRLYMSYFGRSPDVAGLYYWAGRMREGLSLNSVSDSFALSTEFVTRYGLLLNPAFVDLVYHNVLGRSADPGGLSYWLGRLSNGTASRGAVMAGFSESNEYRAATATLVDVVVIYTGLLRRPVDGSGWTFWSGQLDAGTPMSQLVAGLLSSAEYQARF